MSKSTYLIFNLRVCGSETITAAATVMSYIEGISVGDPNSMADAVRYISITQATLQSWFTITPGGDVCNIKTYSILSSLSPVTLWDQTTDTQVLLQGSLGSYVVKIDKTVATNTRTLWVRATTRGLITADRQIQFVICPKTGGNTITPPPAYSPTIVDVTNGGT